MGAITFNEEALYVLAKPVHIPKSFFKDARSYTVFLVILSLFHIVIRTLVVPAVKSKYAEVPTEDSDDVVEVTKPKSFLEKNNGPFALTWGILRFLGLSASFGLTVASVVKAKQQRETLVESMIAITFFYCSVLSFASIFVFPNAKSTHTKTMKLDIVLILFVLFGLYAVRDIWPMLTYTITSADRLNALMWVRLGVLSFVALAPPAFTPPVFTPADPSYPAVPTPEQTAPFLSKILFFFLDPVIFGAWSLPSVPFEKLPPLADVDRAELLRKKMMHILDPLDKSGKSPYLKKFKKGKRVHLIWRILRVWWREIVLCEILSIGYISFDFLPPFGVNRLLNYLETNGKHAMFKPWVWILIIGCGPFLQGLFFNLLIYVSTRFLCRCENIITQLVFEHALRIQLREDPAAKGEDGEEKKKSGNLVGRINNLISSDLDSVINARLFMMELTHFPLGVGLSVFGLYKILGWSSFVGIGFLVLTLPLPAFLSVLQHTTQTKFTEATDARVQRVTEAVNSLRLTKMFGLEERVKTEIMKLRAVELGLNRRRKLLSLAANVANFVLPLLVMTLTFASFTLLQQGELTASRVFSSITVFGTLSQAISVLFRLTGYIESNVSLQRLNTFLQDTELIDRHVVTEEEPEPETDWIGFTNASFTWNKATTTETKDEGDEAQRTFKLKIDDLKFKKGKVNLITGATGCGKTSLFMALLGEMHFEKAPGSAFSLPRSGGVAYADQQSWLLNLTLRENICFGTPYDEERYNQVVKACALERDFSLFDAGDQTEVGEKGLTLSGGQKARITLARAIYSPASILLLDDILSALDVQTARWIIEKCFKSNLVEGRTVLLITHHIAMAAPCAEYLIALADGKVKTQGSVSETLKQDPKLFIEEQIDQAQEEIADEIDVVEGEPGEKPAAKPAADGKLIVAEEKAEGRVSLTAVKLLTSSLGGPIFWIVVIGGILSDQIIGLGGKYWMGVWARQYQYRDSAEVSVAYYLGVYCLSVLAGTITMGIGFTVWQFGAVRSGMVIHRKLLDSIFSATLRFLDSTPQGRIISRFTRDIRTIDGEFTEFTSMVLDMSLMLLMKLVAITIMVPIFSIFGLLLGVCGAVIAELYIHSQLSCKREMSNKKSPLFSHLGDCVAGLVSVRAYGAEAKFRADSLEKVNNYMRTTVIFYNLNRWCNVRFDTMAAVFSTGLTAYLVYGPGHRDASAVGFTLAVSVEFSSYILWFVRILNMWEVAGNSVERVQDYLVIDTEKKNTVQGVPPAYWPASGSIDIKGLTARYSKDGPIVLNNISLNIPSGLRVGVVGRTGSGKSTLALALLRLIPTEGEVFIDGKSCNDINLDALRNSMTIIPQDPTLFSGTLRSNLDPYSDLDDATLNDALKASGLANLQESSTAGGAETPGGSSITLDTQIAPAGENLSQGQKQIVALARGLVRKSKIYIFDEATASVDWETDAKIQTAIRSELAGATLLTIAHRLRSIMDYDYILVLGAGEVLEFDTPKNLLANKDGHLTMLVDQSADADELREMANQPKESK